MEAPSPAEHDNLIRKLQERIKELDCLYAISHIAANPNASLDSILQEITDRIPSGFQQPESMSACVAIGTNATQTANFKRMSGPPSWRRKRGSFRTSAPASGYWSAAKS